MADWFNSGTDMLTVTVSYCLESAHIYHTLPTLSSLFKFVFSETLHYPHLSWEKWDSWAMTLWKRPKYSGSLLPSTLDRSDKLFMVYRVMGPANWSRQTAWSIWTAWRPVHTFSPWVKAEFCFWMALTCLSYLQITLCRLVSDCSSAPSSMQYAI